MGGGPSPGLTQIPAAPGRGIVQGDGSRRQMSKQ